MRKCRNSREWGVRSEGDRGEAKLIKKKEGQGEKKIAKDREKSNNEKNL